ncbi:sensor histidine kinase [Pedobacter sp. UBA5917]|jgi:signal transduction histidine kinase|uniref:sensor histidine kinase n=1 Tax=Pedobacter sp. UBA5917 TaxID=1947061 RepID=UPI0025FB6AE9|nr:HAMP domain-containing sensor histidine kinase [Pedobacter sp. UBA5917]
MDSQTLSNEQFLSGGGEMGALMRSMDWSKNPLGPVENWPQSLRTSVSLCLSSTFPILIAWGPETIQIYNDAYRPICGAMHPESMGMNFRVCWESALEVVGDKFTRGQMGEGTYIKDQQMFLFRYGYLEEAFMTFSFAPIRDETGGVGGIFHPITETTDKMLSARRTQVLRDVAALLGKAKTIEAIGVLTTEHHNDFVNDLPFLLFYVLSPDEENAALISAAGLENASQLAVNEINFSDNNRKWPFSEGQSGPLVIDDLNQRFGDFACKPYPEAPNSAVILPIFLSGKDMPYGYIVTGVSARRAMDEEYLGFYTLLANTFSTAVSNVYAYEQEQKRAEALAAIDRSKTAFFSNVSHEFRTPLTLMLGPLEDLQRHAIMEDPQVRETVLATHRNALRLLKLVNNLLDFSRVEAGRVKAAYQPLDLAGLTADLASSFRSIIEKAGMKLIVETPAIELEAFVDIQMWEKIVLNLLSNAFKYTLEGSITLKLEVLGNAVELAVIDTGVGIPEEELSHMFERFHRVENSAGRTHEGSGIGLSLVSELVHLHGGEIKVESILGQGSKFIINMPLGSAHLPQELVYGKDYQASATNLRESFLQEASGLLGNEYTNAAAPKEEPDNLYLGGEEGKVLVVDDNADMRAYLKRLLEPEFTVYTAVNGADALEQLRSLNPDLILSDIMMPVMDGKTLLAKLREREEKNWIPLIFLSARAGEESRIDGLEAGADDYLVKPFSGQELLSKVRAQIKINRVRRSNEQRMRDFVAVATHELKTPLTALSGYVQVIEMKARKSQEQSLTHAAERARHQVIKMSKLVDDLLDVSKLDEGMLHLKPEHFDLNELINETILDVQSTASKHQINYSGNSGLKLSGDRDKIGQVITNLLVNAVKYAPEAPQVDVFTESDGTMLTVGVRDYGIGIKNEDQQHVFKRFYRTDSAHKGFRGFGIGLYLCAEIINRHGGQINLESEPEKGSLFYFKLPIEN